MSCEFGASWVITSEDGRRCDGTHGSTPWRSGALLRSGYSALDDTRNSEKEAKVGYLRFYVDAGDSAVMVAKRDGLSSGFWMISRLMCKC